MGAPIRPAISKQQIAQIKKWVAEGVTRQSIAHKLNVSIATFYRWIDKYERLKNALEIGQDEDYQVMMNHARKKALDGSYQYWCAYMRITHGINLSDNSSSVHGGAQINVTLNLGTEQSAQVIDQQADINTLSVERTK